MRIIGLLCFLFIGIVSNAQMLSQFNGKFNLGSPAPSGLDSYNVSGEFSDLSGIYNASQVLVNDQVIDAAGNIYIIKTVNSVSGSIISLVVSDPVGGKFPTEGEGIIFRPTTSGFPLVATGASASLLANTLNGAILSLNLNLPVFHSGTVVPTFSGIIGDVVIYSKDSEMYKYTTKGWITIDKTAIPWDYSSSPSEIPIQGAGSLVYNYTSLSYYISNGSLWNAVSTVSDLPAAIKAGDMFYNTNDQKLSVYTSVGQWKELGGGGGSLSPNSVTSTEIADGAVTTTEILNGTIKGEDIGLGQVTTTEIADGTIQSVDIANSAVSVAQLKTAGVTDANMVYTTDASGVPTLVSKSTLGGSTSFNDNRIITRTGIAGVTGQNFNTGKLADFLEKVFFPAQSPYVTKFWITGYGTTSTEYTAQTVDGSNVVVTAPVAGGAVTIPYATWNAGAFANVDFNYTITKRDMGTAISKVELFNGATSLGSNSGDVTSGMITVPKATFSGSAGSQITLTLKVTDAATSEMTIPLKLTFQNPVGVTIPNARISASADGSAISVGSNAGNGSLATPFLIERADQTGTTPVFLCWGAYNLGNDTKVTDITFTTTLPGVTNMTSGTYTSVTNKSVSLPNSDYNAKYYGTVQVKGDVAGTTSAQTSPYYQLGDRTYCGYVGDLTQPNATTVKGLTSYNVSYMNTALYYAVAGISLVNTTFTSGHIIWAVPKYNAGTFIAPSVLANNLGTWSTVTDKTVFDMTIDGKPYWICIYNASVGTATGQNTSIVKLSN